MDDALRKRLAALRATAQGKGTTEAEAMAAAAKMAQILAECGLSEDEIEFEEAEAPLRTKRPTTRTALIGVIAVCTNCAGTIRSDWRPAVIYLGRAPGPEIAVYLTTVCDRAIDRAVEDFKKTAEYRRRRTLTTKRKAVQDFTIGMVERLEGRLFQMFRAGVDKAARAKAVAVRDHRMPASTPVTMPQQSVRFGSAAASGSIAGSEVQLAHAMSGGRKAPRIGGL
ncbi:hypothetical protein [Paracoccus sp. ME4]|uniref:DUF7168 domain-containing protein n=1 Tax=Paracoccus sp. ME4 TaxID=3138066 RepID=UPI00398B26DC